MTSRYTDCKYTNSNDNRGLTNLIKHPKSLSSEVRQVYLNFWVGPNAYNFLLNS